MHDLTPAAVGNPDLIGRMVLDLVRTPSPTGNEQQAIEWVRAHISRAADTVDGWVTPMSELERDRAYPGREVDRTDVPVIAAEVVGSRPGPTIVLTGHVDVVPIGDRERWSRDPHGALHDGFIYGRGACDMKGGLVAALTAFNALADGPRDFSGRVRFVAVPGEEDGGTGSLAAIRRGWTGDYVVIPEPSSGPDGPRIVAAHGGALTYTIGVEGRSAHAATRREGESALDHFITVYDALRCLENDLNTAETNRLMANLGLPYPTTVGIVRGGDWASNVMEHLTAEVRVGVAIDETIDEAEARFEQSLYTAIAGDPWLRKHPPSIERTGAAFGSSAIAIDHPLVSALASAAEAVTGQRPPIVGAPYGCDMALWIREGEAAALVYGPGDVSCAHAADEFVDLDEVAVVARVLDRTVRSILEGSS